ncbi:MAG TPA: tetratricopeptide repeat protein [Cyclobacteriaceae bacterium]|nr:tetratricopeptide repeat protein [Cyclobacteriaceae bacterium]
MVGCSSEQTTVTSNLYHNLTAHYNGYYYAREKITEVEQTIQQSLDDDHNQILRLYPKLDTTLAKTYEKDTEEAIKMASLSIQRHPNSKWVYPNYIMVGLARMYDCDFVNAVQTFKYVNTKSKDINTRHQALLNLIRAFTENEEYEKAEEAFRFLEKEPLSKPNAKKLYLEKAYYYQVLSDYNNMVRNLTLADSLLGKQDQRGRIYFIIGQVYQKLGFGSEAYNYYRKCIATNPAYEIDFYARLNMAQVARLDDTRDIKTVRKQFEKMLADAKNQEFRDKIYFELAKFELKQGNLAEAITNYTYAAHAGSNKRIQGSAYLQLGQIHFDSLKKYSIAKNYYDSAVSALPPDFENLDNIKKRQEVLGDFAKYTETILWQDSLLLMASMDSLTLRAQLDSVIASRKSIEEAVKKKKRRSQGSTNTNQNNPFFLEDSNTTADWYFGNLSAVGAGQIEFSRIWGNIPLEDNWRRSNKSSVIVDEIKQVTNVEESEDVIETAENEKSTDEAGKIFSQLPLTESAKAKALAKIEDAYFNLGDLYYLKLNEKSNASNSYTTLLDRFPDSEFEPEVLYKLYLIHTEMKNDIGESYYNRLINNHPNSSFAKLLLNPNYLKETSVAAEKQKEIYKDAYKDFENGRSQDSQEKLNQAFALGETSFTPQLELLKILITGKTEDITRYQAELETFLGKNPDGPLNTYAKSLLSTSKSLQEKFEKSRNIRYVNSLQGPHYFVISHLQLSKMSDLLSATLDEFIRKERKGNALKTSTLILNEKYILTMVGKFPDPLSAVEFLDKFHNQTLRDNTLSSYKFDIFVITKENSDILYRTKALDEYLTFFDRNYKVKNQ